MPLDSKVIEDNPNTRAYMRSKLQAVRPRLPWFSRLADWTLGDLTIYTTCVSLEFIPIVERTRVNDLDVPAGGDYEIYWGCKTAKVRKESLVAGTIYLPSNDTHRALMLKYLHTNVLDLVFSNTVNFRSASAWYRSQQLLRQEWHVRKAPSVRLVSSFWICGPAGIGKTLRVTHAFPGAFVKVGTDHFFDGYDMHKTIVVHELNENTFDPDNKNNLVQHYKNWTDPYNVGKLLPVKGSFTPAAYSLFIVTSNTTLRGAVSKLSLDEQRAFKRRFTEVNIHSPAQEITSRHRTTGRWLAMSSLLSILPNLQ